MVLSSMGILSTCGKKNCGSEEVEFSELQTLNSLHIVAGEWGRVHIWISDSHGGSLYYGTDMPMSMSKKYLALIFLFLERRARGIKEKREKYELPLECLRNNSPRGYM